MEKMEGVLDFCNVSVPVVAWVELKQNTELHVEIVWLDLNW